MTGPGADRRITRRGLLRTSLGAGVGITALAGSASFSDAKAAGSAENLLSNPGFESVVEGLPEHWRPVGTNAADRIVSTSDQVRGGDAAVRLHDPDAGTAVGLRSGLVPVRPGIAYQASVFSYDEAGTSQLYLEFWDAAERRLTVEIDQNPQLNVWQRLRVWGTAPTDAAYATVLLYLPTGNAGTSYYDDAWLGPDTQAPVLTDLGPASEVTSTSVAEPVNGRIWTATSGVSPVQVGGFDLATHTIDRTIALPSGDGTWAMTHIGTDLYVGTYTPGDLYRIDTESSTATKLANFGSFVWSLATTPDGRIVAGTYPDAGVFEYDPATGETKAYGTAVEGEQYVRSIVADETTIYAGVGAHAHLIAIDRSTGAKTELLPDSFADRTFVATLAIAGTRLAAALSPTATMLLFDTTDPTRPVEVQVPDDQYITAITIDPDAADPRTADIYLGTRPSGTLYRYVAATGDLERLGSPYDGAYFNRIVSTGDRVVAELTSQVVEFDPATGEFTGYDLVEAGLPPQPELAMRMLATRNTVLVSGKAGIQVHDLATGESGRTFVTGEAKTMTLVGNKVYLGVYTLARLLTMRPDGSDLTELIRIENQQTRPSGAVYHAPSNRLLVTTEPEYGFLEGVLAFYDIGTGELVVHRGVVPDQSIASLAVHNGIAYLGSHIRNLGADPVVDTATVSAFDLETSNVRWQITPVEGAERISDLASYRGRMYGTTDNGNLLELDPATGKVTAIVSIGTGMSALAKTRDGLYGTDGKRLFEVVPSTSGAPVVETVVSGLAAETYSFPMIVPAFEGSALYTIERRNLVRVTGLP